MGDWWGLLSTAVNTGLEYAADVGNEIGNVAGDVAGAVFDGGGVDIFTKMESIFDLASNDGISGEVANISTSVGGVGDMMSTNAGNFSSLANDIVGSGVNNPTDPSAGLLGTASKWLENPATRAGLGHAARALIEDRQINKIQKGRLEQVKAANDKTWQGAYYVPRS